MGWKLEFTDGPPERALLEAAGGADLLVIGTRAKAAMLMKPEVLRLFDVGAESAGTDLDR